jgi:HisJ family histidinol phosphate phosphatase
MMRTSTQIHDEHMHLRRHGVSPLPAHELRPMFEACKAKSVVPGIREHAPLPRRYRLGPDEDYLFCMRVDEVEPFLDQLTGSGVALGLEVDHLDGQEAETREIVEDLLGRARKRGIAIGGLTGSVHFIPGSVDDLGPGVDKGGVPHILCDYLETVMLAHLAEHGAGATIKDYFASLQRLIRTGFYDVVGHIELVRKWDRLDENGKSKLFGDVEDLYREELDRTLRLAGEADILVEYNTSGRDIVIGRPYLSDDAVRACVRYGVRIALSSDAHVPKQVGRYFDEAISTLKGLGVRELCAVRDRERIAISI